MDGDLPNNTAIGEDVSVCHHLDIDMIDTATAELGEVNDEDNIVLRETLHHSEQVSPARLSAHHVASVMSSTQTRIMPTTSGSHSSCTTPFPWTTPPPTAITMRPDSRSSCSYDDERKDYDELPPHSRRGPFAACLDSGVTTTTTAVLTSRS